ncbi:MAG: glycosyltransferase family 4 protein [Eubacteriales bacterium]|nr:glycosyltransferase family 4 protein [Eubacteriales bacterium]
MMRVLYLTNIPSPYRVDFFNELGKLCDLTVLFETRYSKERDERWVSETETHYRPVFMRGIRHGVAEAICPEVIKYLSPEKFDIIVVGMYSSPTGMIAIEYMRLKKIKFILNTDGGLIKEDNGIRHKLKAHFIGAASAWLSTGDMATDYLCYYGAKREKVYKYPFTSVKRDEIISANSMSGDMKNYMKKQLGIKEEKIILTVGRFTYEEGYGKGYDSILKAAERIDPSIGIYIVGDEPTEEFIKWKDEKNLTQVHYIGFQKKNELAKFYAAADLFVLMTKMDVWGLVINEAMMYSLPVITTDQCGAGVELVRNGENGYVIPVGDYDSLAEKIAYILSDSNVTCGFGKRSYEIIFNYTLEQMADCHYKTFEKLGGDT